MPINFKRSRVKFGEGDNRDPNQDPARVLVYGTPKTRKTWWASTAAETHNVYLLNGDRNTGILRNLPEAMQENVHLIPVALNPSPTSSTFLKFLTLMFEKQDFIYDYETDNEIPLAKVKDNETYLACNLSLLSKRDVLLLDGWTAIVKDVASEYMIDHNINAWAGSMQSNKNNNKYSYFAYSGLVLDNVLQGVNKLPCHVIMTAHQDEYERDVKENGISKKKTITQILSSSGNQAAKIPAVLGDVLWFKHSKDATKTIIDSRPDNDRAGGGARLRPATFEFPEWTWKDYCKEANVGIENNLLAENDIPALCLLTGAEIKELVNGVNKTPETNNTLKA
jgi:hypothetical protein